MDELEHFKRIDGMMARMVESLRRSREMHDNLAAKLDMARTDAANELIKEVEEYLAEHGDRR
jgi:DNA repair ATPase RecN